MAKNVQILFAMASLLNRMCYKCKTSWSEDFPFWKFAQLVKDEVFFTKPTIFGCVRLASLGHPRSAPVRSNSFWRHSRGTPRSAPSALLVEWVTWGLAPGKRRHHAFLQDLLTWLVNAPPPPTLLKILNSVLTFQYLCLTFYGLNKCYVDPSLRPFP